MTAASVVDRLAGALPGRIGRRGFLTRTALVGSALASSPVSYVLRPGTAYAAVCNCKGLRCDCGAACCDGYTEFCCTITGANRCPPGTIVAGWWKADTAPDFCGGPRYYIDCNAQCHDCGCGPNGLCGGHCSGTGCGCVAGSCDNRAAGCNVFRYGQCNQGIPCVGPIVCRVVTCVPPWAIEPSCTTVTRVDEYTAFQDSPCLHQVIGYLDGVHSERNTTMVHGWALDYDTDAPVVVQAFVNGALAAETVANGPRPDVGDAYPGYGGAHGFSLAVPHPGPPHTVCVVALNAGAGAGNVELGCRPVPLRLTGSPFGSLDVVTATRRTVRVAGWVIDPDRPGATAVHVYVGGRHAGSGLASGQRPDVGSAYPRSGPAHGFDLAVPSPPGAQEVCVYGINIGDGSPNALIGCRTVNVPEGRPVGRVEQLLGAPGLLRITGFAFDPDDRGSVPIHVYDGANLLVTGMATIARPDVEAYFHHGPAHGFDLWVEISGGSHHIRTHAIDIAGGDSNSLIDERWVNIPSGPPYGYLDVADPVPGGVRVGGWAIDPDTFGPVDIHVYADNRLVGAGRADLDRPDVGAVSFYGPRHGFSFVVPLQPGFHVVQAYGLNRGLPAPNTQLIGTRWVVVT
jgi:hypothetical protein